MAYFVAVIHKEENSDYGVSFPDFPGCITAGKTIQEAAEMAKEALRGHIEVMHENNEKLPTTPSELDDIAEQVTDYTALFMVEAPLPSKPVRVNVMLDSNLLQRIDREFKNRSEFLNKAAIHELERQHTRA